MNPLLEIATVLTHLGDALSNITKGIAQSIRHGYKTFDLIAARRAKTRLTKLHKYGTELGAMQVALMERTMSWYLNEPSAAHWEEAKQDIQKVFEAIPELSAEVREASSAFALEPTYKELLLTLEARRSILAALLELEPPRSADELSQLREVRDRYHDLMDKLETLQFSLSEYIKKYYPLENPWLDDAG